MEPMNQGNQWFRLPCFQSSMTAFRIHNYHTICRSAPRSRHSGRSDPNRSPRRKRSGNGGEPEATARD